MASIHSVLFPVNAVLVAVMDVFGLIDHIFDGIDWASVDFAIDNIFSPISLLFVAIVNIFSLIDAILLPIRRLSINNGDVR